MTLVMIMNDWATGSWFGIVALEQVSADKERFTVKQYAVWSQQQLHLSY